jgi:hypothetical protein
VKECKKIALMTAHGDQDPTGVRLGLRRRGYHVITATIALESKYRRKGFGL